MEHYHHGRKEQSGIGMMGQCDNGSMGLWEDGVGVMGLRNNGAKGQRGNG